MGDLLSSASLLITIVTVLYGLWNPNFKKVLDAPTPDYQSQCVKPIEEIESVIWRNAVPLTVVAYTIVLVFAKNALELYVSSCEFYAAEGIVKGLEKYNAVGTAFVLIVLLSLVIAFYLSSDCAALFRKRRELKAVTG